MGEDWRADLFNNILGPIRDLDLPPPLALTDLTRVDSRGLRLLNGSAGPDALDLEVDPSGSTSMPDQTKDLRVRACNMVSCGPWVTIGQANYQPICH